MLAPPPLPSGCRPLLRGMLDSFLIIVKYFILQPRQTISLNKLESHEIRTFPEVKWKQFAFLDYGKKVALFGKETKGAEPRVHIFALEGGWYKELRDQRLPAPCTHQWSVEMTSLSLGTLGYSYLIFTCYACKDIKMVDVDHKKTYVVHSSGYRYNRFCAGGEDAVFVYTFGDPFEVRLCACSWACIITARKRSLRRLCFYTCLSVHSEGVPGQVPPWAGTPPWQVPPGQVHPPWAGTPPGHGQVHPPGQLHPWAGTPPCHSACWDMVNKWAVRIHWNAFLLKVRFCACS